MKHLIFALLITLFSCNTDCVSYYYYSPNHEAWMLLDSTRYKPLYVNGIKYTQSAPSDMLKLYQRMWNDTLAVKVFEGCPDTLHIEEQKAP